MEKVLGIIRHILTFLGGFLVSKGLIEPEMVTEVVAALITLVGIVWSIVDKDKRDANS